MRNDCPSCNTVYAVTPQDVGKRIICKQCNAALVIAEACKTVTARTDFTAR